jgi:glutamine cyclotransferase
MWSCKERSRKALRNCVTLAASLLLISSNGPAPAAAEDISADPNSARYKANIPVEVLKRVSMPQGGYHEGLLFDGENIWVNNGKNRNTWVIDPRTGKIVREIIPPGTFTEGITASSDHRYWVTDWDERKLYRVTIEDNKMVSDLDISLAPARPTGVVWTGEELYVMTWTGTVQKQYHLLRMDAEGNILERMRMRGMQEPSQITWDSKHLWITSWADQKVYKVDPATNTVLGHFISPSKRATGIVWDSGHFWITGTYDHLYKVKVPGSKRDK